MTDSADDILGPPALVWRDDPLFNQGVIAAELAIAVIRERVTDGPPWDTGDAEHAIEHLEAFLDGARAEAAERAK